jgi:ribonuclease P protein component
MRREQRLRANADFVRVRREGHAWSHPLLVLHAAPGGGALGQSRVGVTVGRWAGGAVVRNRARRRVREAVRLRYDEIERGWDLVFVVRATVTEASFDAIAGAVSAVLARARLLRAETSCPGSHSR